MPGLTSGTYLNYPYTVTKGGTSVGYAQVLNWPEIMTGETDITNPASVKWREKRPNGLIEAGDWSLLMILVSGTLPTVMADVEAETVSEFVLSDDFDTFTFDGWYKSFQKEAADSRAPEAARATVVIAVTGSIDIS